PESVDSPRHTAYGSVQHTVSGENVDIKRMASGPPIIIPIVPVKNMIRALGPRLKMALRSILSVIRTRDAGSRYLLAIKYNCEVLSSIIPSELKMAGIR